MNVAYRKKDRVLSYTRFPVNRIVVYGDEMNNAVDPDSATPFNFQTAHRLTNATVGYFI